MSIGKYLPTFRSIIVPPSSRSNSKLQRRISGTATHLKTT